MEYKKLGDNEENNDDTKIDVNDDENKKPVTEGGRRYKKSRKARKSRKSKKSRKSRKGRKGRKTRR